MNIEKNTTYFSSQLTEGTIREYLEEIFLQNIRKIRMSSPVVDYPVKYKKRLNPFKIEDIYGEFCKNQ